MRLPLDKRLKKRLHLNVALLQDELMEALYCVDNELVFHGGTAIWRCYRGNRFSEDLDLYSNHPKRIEERFKEVIEQRGLELRKFKKTNRVFFAKVSNGQVEVRAEINFSVKKKGVATSFERVDGSFTQVFCLTQEELLLEKIQAYENRRLIRDVFDVLHLSNYVKADARVNKRMRAFLENPVKPIDESNLKTIVYSGAILSFQQIIEALKRRFT